MKVSAQDLLSVAGKPLARGQSLLRMIRSRIRPDAMKRVAADAVLVNCGLIAGFLARLYILLLVSPGDAGSGAQFFVRVARNSAVAFAASAPLMTALAIATFALFGFYSRGRAYQGRYKALIILQAVSVAYLTGGALMYALFGVAGWLPRTAWAAGWAFTLFFVGGARLAAGSWRRTILTEVPRAGRPTRRKVRNVLVIGGAGYIGSVLSRRLIRSGYDVTVLDALLYGDDGIRGLLPHPRFRLIDGDFRDLRAVVEAMEHQDAVVHLGGLVGDPACAVDERLTRQINTTATRMIADVARGFGVPRFVFASSCSVYGAGEMLLDERSKLNPVSLYAQTKIDGERMLLDMASEKFAPTNLRFATLYGYSPRPRFDLVVNLLTALAVTEGKIRIDGGQQWRPFVHVSDVAKAIEAVLTAPLDAVHAQTFNVGSDGQNMQIGTLADLIRDHVPDVDVVIDESSVDARNYRVSFARLRRLLNFKPEFGIADGIREVRDAIKAGAVLDVRDDRFNNMRGLATTLDYLTSSQGSFPYDSPAVLDVRDPEMTSRQT